MKLLVNKQECDEVRDSFVAIELRQRKVVGNRIYSPIRAKVLESTTRATYNKFIIYKQPISEKVLNVFKNYL
jgi:predicted thioesterase